MELEQKITADEEWLQTWVDWFGTDDIDTLAELVAGDDLKAAIAWRGVRAEALARRGEHAAAVELGGRGRGDGTTGR